MLIAGIIELVDELDWVNRMVVQEKKGSAKLESTWTSGRLMMPMFTIHFRHHLWMKYWRMLAVRKLSHTRMASQGTIRSRSRER